MLYYVLTPQKRRKKSMQKKEENLQEEDPRTEKTAWEKIKDDQAAFEFFKTVKNIVCNAKNDDEAISQIADMFSQKP